MCPPRFLGSTPILLTPIPTYFYLLLFLASSCPFPGTTPRPGSLGPVGLPLRPGNRFLGSRPGYRSVRGGRRRIITVFIFSRVLGVVGARVLLFLLVLFFVFFVLATNRILPSLKKALGFLCLLFLLGS